MCLIVRVEVNDYYLTSSSITISYVFAPFSRLLWYDLQ